MSNQEESARAIEYLCPPAPVSMAQRWFEIASLDHFWVRRRFAVLQKLMSSKITAARELAEVGCGHGLLQRQIEDAYGKEVWGFDLNEPALKRNVSRRCRLSCYDIFQQDAALRQRFDLILLFDVLEHISDETAFLQALLFHLAPKGNLLVNVPAGQWAYSRYDKAVGHVRRYSVRTLSKAVWSSRLTVKEWTYWGLPLVPFLALRKLWLVGKRDQGEIISGGMDSRTASANALMGILSRLEWLPQKFLGASMMAVLERAEGANPLTLGKGYRD